MNEGMKAFWLGLFIIGAVVLTGWLVLFLKPSLGNGEEKLVVRFSNIDKISEGTRVTFGGKPVGEVVRIREIPNLREAPADSLGNLYIYELTLKVDSSVKIYSYDEIIFATSGLLGERSISIIPRATAQGASPAHEITHDILYARSTDKLEESINKLTHVADRFQDTLQYINCFIETNQQDFNDTLKSLIYTTREMRGLIADANAAHLIERLITVSECLVCTLSQADLFFSAATQYRIIERLGSSFDSIHRIADLFSCGEGTIARLVNSDCLYVQVMGVLCHLQTVLHDIQNYGILYQFDRKWQKLNNYRRSCTEISGQGYCQN
jgi:phospholipid/cholesterol/gamma-HCH transport system substrate-binding protein